MERIMGEVENEFEFQDEKLRIEPRVFVPDPDYYIPPKKKSAGLPPFCQDFIVGQQKRQPVAVKLDSIIIKGSKILAKHPKSEFVEGSIYLIAKTYFYKEEWLPCQIKCGELIDKYPIGKLSPDAHLLMAKALLIQRKFEEGKIVLSRTVDVAWQLKRYDILSEAFRLEAETYLYENDIEKALRPYRQAVVQGEDCKYKALWQTDLAALLYKIGKFERAYTEFKKVRKFCPEYVVEYESYLYEAECLAQMGKFKEANEILDDIYKDGKYKEWQKWAGSSKLDVARLMNLKDSTLLSDDSLLVLEKAADTMFTNSPPLSVYNFNRAIDYYGKDDYKGARNYFAKAKVAKSPIIYQADLMHKLLNQLDRKSKLDAYSQKEIDSLIKFKKLGTISDSMRCSLASGTYEIARVQEILQKNDSALYSYKTAMELAPNNDSLKGKYIFTYSERVRQSDPYTADSLLEILVDKYTYTPYGTEAMAKLGFTVSIAIDSAAELFESGHSSMKFGNYPLAITLMDSIYYKYPESDYAPKSLYTIGWIYETHYNDPNEALCYYQLLVRDYPNSEYAKEVTYSVDLNTVLATSAAIPDTLKPRGIVQSQKRFKFDEVKIDPNLNAKQTETSPLNMTPEEMIKNPGKLFQKARDLLKDPLQKIKEQGAELIKDPKSLIKIQNPLDQFKKQQDSTKTIPQDTLKNK
jgi:tetratricopeptide (TPR) repeat protein